MTHDQLMQAYEKAALAFHKTKPMTQAASKAGKRMDKAAQALEAFRIQQKRLAGNAISVYESAN